MRAICEACARPQPRDWRAGDHCVWCGDAVRHEVRCFWCARWTPAVKFCRTCGANTVEPTVYGAARMLKDAGCDRFTIPKQLVELDPEQIDNFTRIYQEHAAIAAHHVEQVEFLERFLEQKYWSAELDETLASQLPWSLEQLKEMRAAAKRVPAQIVSGQGANVERARAIGTATPFPTTRVLSTFARVALEDWTALDDAMGCTGSSDEALRTEALLAVSNWRVLYGPGLPSRRRDIMEELRRCPLRAAASIRLALLGEPTGEPLPAGEFATALANDDVDFLSAAAREPGDHLRRFAAAQKLITHGILSPVAEVLLDAPEDHQVELLGQLERRKKPAPELRDALFKLAGDTKSPKVLQYSCYVLCYGCRAEDALRIARVAEGDPRVYQALLQKAGLSPATMEQFGEFLLDSGEFSMNQYGMNDAAKQGRMPANFVPKHWPRANAETRVELCKFAEQQLSEYGDETLHRFLVNVAFTRAASPGDADVHDQAWSGLHRWYDSFGYPRRRPIRVSEESIATFFGTPRQFLVRLAEILRERPVREAIDELIIYPNCSALSGIAGAPRDAKAAMDALADVMRDTGVDLSMRLHCTEFLGFLGSEPTLSGPAGTLLKSFLGTDVGVQAERTLQRMINGPAWE